MIGKSMQRLRELAGDRRAPLLVLGLAVLASAIWLISLDSHLTFIADDWELLVKRHGYGLGVYLDPFKEHPIAGPALIFKLLLATFGMGSSLPYYVASIALFFASAALLFVYLRRRIGAWLALLGAVSILFLGAAFEDFLWISPINFYGSMVAGLAMLLALDRGDERGDRIACAALAVSIAFSSLGIAFAAGALVDLALGRRPKRRRAYVALLPLALYGAWWLVWGRSGASGIDLASVPHLPAYVFRAAAAGVTALLGLASNDGSESSQPHLIWGRLALVAALALAALRIRRQRRVSRDLAAVLAIALAFWVLTGVKPNLPNLAESPEHFATSSRYQYISAVFLLLIAAELLRGLRVPAPAIAALAVLVGLAAWGGISLLQREYSRRWRPAADSLRSSLAAADVAGSAAQPGFLVSFPPALAVTARTYLAAAREHGTPAYTEAELAARSEPEREAADLTIAQAEGLALVEPARRRRTVACQTLHASPSASTGVTLRHGGFTILNRSGAPVEVLLSRFAEGFSVDLGPLPAGERTALTIPPDESIRPWSFGLAGSGPVRLCTTSAAGRP